MQQLIRNNKNTVDRRVMNSSMFKRDISSQHRCCLVDTTGCFHLNNLLLNLAHITIWKKNWLFHRNRGIFQNKRGMGNWVENRGKSQKFDDTFSIHISKFLVDKIWTDIAEYSLILITLFSSYFQDEKNIEEDFLFVVFLMLSISLSISLQWAPVYWAIKKKRVTPLPFPDWGLNVIPPFYGRWYRLRGLIKLNC